MMFFIFLNVGGSRITYQGFSAPLPETPETLFLGSWPESPDKKCSTRIYIFLSLAERRQFDVDDLQPVVQVFTESPLMDYVLHIFRFDEEMIFYASIEGAWVSPERLAPLQSITLSNLAWSTSGISVRQEVAPCGGFETALLFSDRRNASL